jgi:hypothetical protein
MKYLRVSYILSAVAGAALLGGCAAQPEAIQTKSLFVDPAIRVQLFQAAEETLGSMHFVIDKLDVNSGVVHTQPLRAAQFFELWRGDNVGSFNAAEANLNTLRRVVELRVTEEEGFLHVACDVRVQRLSLPENEVISVSQAYRMHSRSKISVQRFELSPRQEKLMTWIDLGRDEHLAQKILERIAGRLKRLEEQKAA